METAVSAGIIGIGLGAQYALLSLGFTLIYGILGVINFSHGGFYMLGGYVAFAVVSKLGLPYPVAVVAATLFCAAYRAAHPDNKLAPSGYFSVRTRDGRRLPP